MVSNTSIVFMGITSVFVLALAIALPIVIKKKWQTAVSPYFIGWAVFFVFALVLESLMHSAVLGATGDTITGNMWLYALYGGFAAGIFEETGRFLAMKLLMKKHYSNSHNALMYGAGQGCFEALILVGLTMIGNIALAAMINAGQTDMLLASVPAEQQETLKLGFSQLTDTPSYMFLLSAFERISAVIVHISFSVLVWTAVVKKKFYFYPLAIFLHALFDGVAVIMQSCGVNTIVIEIALFAFSAGIALFTYYIWKKELKSYKTESVTAVSENGETEQ